MSSVVGDWHCFYWLVLQIEGFLFIISSNILQLTKPKLGIFCMHTLWILFKHSYQLSSTESQCQYNSESSIRSKPTSVRRKYCGTETPKVLTANNTYFYFYFQNKLGLTYNMRGFIVGYMTYSKFIVTHSPLKPFVNHLQITLKVDFARG